MIELITIIEILSKMDDVQSMDARIGDWSIDLYEINGERRFTFIKKIEEDAE